MRHKVGGRELGIRLVFVWKEGSNGRAIGGGLEENCWKQIHDRSGQKDVDLWGRGKMLHRIKELGCEWV